MHLEILVEDQSGKVILDELVPEIIGSEHTYRVKSYKGSNDPPKGMKDPKNVGNRILSENLPKLLKGYGKTFSGYGANFCATVIVVCDLDRRCMKDFRKQLLAILCQCNPQPSTRFCFAIEEGEAWLLGDIPAIRAAYPQANMKTLNQYTNDSICGTWEWLADCIHEGGAQALMEKGFATIGLMKSRWANAIVPYMNIEENQSPSFCYFRDTLRRLIQPVNETADE